MSRGKEKQETGDGLLTGYFRFGFLLTANSFI